MTGLVMHSLHTSLEIEPWDQLHFILLCFGMPQTKFYPSRWKSKVLATKNRDKLIMHLPVAHTHFCKKKHQTLSLIMKNGAIELWKVTLTC
jgi:hypothetical protein